MASGGRRKSSGGSKGRKGHGRGGLMGAIGGVFSFIVILGIVIAMSRATGINDADSAIRAAKSSVNPMQSFAGNVYEKAKKLLSCNFLINSGCVSKPTGGDLSGLDNIPTPSGDLGKAAGDLDKKGEDAAKAVDEKIEAAKKELSSVTIAPKNTKAEYNRGKDWPHWAIISGRCDARETVLGSVGFSNDPKTCKALPKEGFSYTEPYAGAKVSDPSKLDIDHLIPLEFVARHGGSSWSQQKRTQYANDVSAVLVAVDAGQNRSKGSKGPGEWMPKNTEYHCEYAEKWLSISSKYGISMEQSDKTALSKALGTCS